MAFVKIIPPSTAQRFLNADEKRTLTETITGQKKVQYQGLNTYVAPSYNTTRGILAPKGYKSPAEILQFQFNPEEISDTKGINYTEKNYTGFSASRYFYSKGGTRAIEFKLFFDATAGSNNKKLGKNTPDGYAAYDTLLDVYPRGVMDMVEKLTSFLYPILDNDYNGPRFVQGAGGTAIPSKRFLPPPVGIFVFGDFYMECVVASVTSTYTLFNASLQPVRAECNVTLNILEADTVIVDQRLTKKTPSTTAQGPFIPDSFGA